MNLRSPITTIVPHLRSRLACMALAFLGACGGGDPDATSPASERDKAAAATAPATTVYRVLTRDTFAYASYYEYGADGCSQRAVEVFGSQSMTRTNNTSVFMPIVRIQMSTYNFCTGEFSFMSGADEAPVISISNNLTSANVKGTVVMMDELGNTKNVVADLNWSGGEITTDRNRYVTTSPYSRTMVRSTGSVRNSTSIVGTLVLDGLDLFSPENVNQSSGIFGFVTASRGTTIDIIRTR
jgi:hypothetical protein